MKKGLDFLFESFLLENNKMKNLLSITFFVLCYACSSNERIFDVDTVLNLEASECMELKGERLPIDALGGYGIKVFDTLLVVTTDNPNHFRDVYGLKSYSLLSQILRKGRAKNEFLFAGYNGQNVKENGCIILYLHDLNKNVFWKYNLTESIRQNMDIGKIIYKLPGRCQGAYFLSTDIFCYQDIVSGKGYLYVIKNVKKNEVIEEYTIMKDGEIPLSSYIMKDNDVIICYSRNVDQLMFIDINKRTKISVSTSNEQPTWSKLNSELNGDPKVFYDYIATTEQEIYALYKGNPDYFEIHCFSKTGDFLKKMILKEKIISFDVAGNTIYGLTTDEEIFKYKI